MTSDGLFAVAATINGADVDALVDTGSSSVVLSYKDAMLAGIRPETLKFNQSVMTSRGITQAARVKIYHVTVEDIVVHDIDGMVMPKGTLDGTLLGMSFLNRLNGLQASIKSYPFDH